MKISNTLLKSMEAFWFQQKFCRAGNYKQRMMVTFDGKVGMCCHDWGAKHCIGYLDKKAFKDDSLKDVEKKITQNKKGFELLSKAKMPKNYNSPDKKVSALKEIWNGDELNKVRKLHSMNKVNDVEICKGCTFKNSYNGKKYNIYLNFSK